MQIGAMERDAQVVMRFPSGVKDALRRAAEADQRTMSTLALIILREWLEKHGHLPKSPTRRRGKGR
jgi:hypothetical protein